MHDVVWDIVELVVEPRRLSEHRPAGVSSANDARAVKTGLASSRAAGTKKLPLARHDNTSSTLPVRQHRTPVAAPDICSRIRTYGRQLGLQVPKRDAVPYPLGRARPLFTLFLRLRDVHGLDSLSPHQWHSGYHRQLRECNQSYGFITFHSSLNDEVEILKEAIV